jgi:hypothetical protein
MSAYLHCSHLLWRTSVVQKSKRSITICTVSWVLTPCSSEKNINFNLQNRRVSQERNQLSLPSVSDGLMFAWLNLQPWRWWRYVPQKRRGPSELHGVTTRITGHGSKHLISNKFPSIQCLLGLTFNHEDGGDMFLRNVGVPPNYTALQPGLPDTAVNTSYPTNFPVFNETHTFMVRSQKPTAGLYPKPDEFSPHSVLLSSYSGIQNRNTYFLHVCSFLVSYATLSSF